MTTGPRVTPGLVHDILDALERHGYYRSDDLHTDRAIGLIGDLACIYEGTQDHPAYPFMVPPSPPAYPGPSHDHRADPQQGPQPGTRHPVPRDRAARRAGIRRGERRRPARSPSRGPDSQEPRSRTGAGDGGRRGASPSQRPSPEGRAGRAGGTPAVSTAIGARGLRCGQKQAPG